MIKTSKVKTRLVDEWNDDERPAYRPRSGRSGSDDEKADANNPIEILIKQIFVPEDRRPNNSSKVRALARSIEKGGLCYPIAVYERPGMHTKPYVLVAGGHRTAAHIKLKRKSIPAVVIDKEKAAAWEVEENLLRSEPNALERADYIHKYASAVRAINPTGKQQGGIQPHDRSISRVARALGFSRKAVSDAFLHHALSSKVRGLLVEHGLHKKASFLTRIAKMDNQSNQICAIEDRAGLRVAVKACGKAYERGEKSAATDRSRDEPFLPSFQSLEKAWKESAVRSIYEGSPRNVRQAFVRKIS